MQRDFKLYVGCFDRFWERNWTSKKREDKLSKTIMVYDNIDFGIRKYQKWNTEAEQLLRGWLVIIVD